MLVSNRLGHFIVQDRNHWLRFGAFLAFVQFISYPGIFLGLESFIYRDFGFFGYPLAHYHRESFWDGEIPFWNPLSNMGMPFLAQWNSLVLYPGSLIYLLLPSGWGVSLFCLFHQWLGGMGMYSLTLKWTDNRSSASLAAIIYSFNGLFLNSLAWPNNSAALSWFPWLLMSLQLAFSNGGKWFYLSILFGSLQMLTGGPEIIIFTWIFCGVVSLSSLNMDFKSLGSGVLKLTSIAFWVSCIAAPQLLPFLRLISESHRSSDYSSDGWSMPITGWGNFIVPKFQTFFSHAGVHFQPEQVWTTSYYIGIFSLVLIGIYLASRPNRAGWTMFILCFLAANMAMGPYNPLFKTIKESLPLMGFMRYPVKYVILIILGAPLLAGLGWHSLTCKSTNESQIKNRPDPRWLWIFSMLITALAGILIGYSYLWPLQNEVPALTKSNGLLRIFFLWALAFMAFIISKNYWKARSWGSYVIPLILVTELLTHTSQQNPTVKNDVLEPGLLTLKNMEPIPVFGKSRAMLSPTADTQMRFKSTDNPFNDYLIYRSGLFSNCNLLDGIAKVNGFYSMYINRSVDILRIFYGRELQAATPLKNFLGISHYSMSNPIYEWETRSNYMPLITSGQTPRPSSEEERLSILKSEDFNPEETVFLDQDEIVISELARVQGDIKFSESSWHQAEIRDQKITKHEISFESEADGPSIAVVAQNHYPNWKAFVDGKPAQLLKANHSFQAVVLPKGIHQVKIQYKEKDFFLGGLLSLGAIIILTTHAVVMKQRNISPSTT